MAKSFDLRSYLEKGYHPEKHGNEYVINCPDCFPQGKDKKLWCNVEKRTAICYFCNVGYDVPNLIATLERCSTLRLFEIMREHASSEATANIRQEVERVFRVLAGTDNITAEEDKLVTVPLPEGFVPAYEHEHDLPEYFKQRRISWKRAVKYNLGWCTSGYFDNRLVVPVLQQGQLVTFHARYMKAKPPNGLKKVLYPKGAKTGRCLFNIDVSRAYKLIVLTEDCFSSMAVGHQGSGCFGTSLSRHQISLLLNSNAEEIAFLWDRDALDKAYKYAEQLAEYWKVRVVELPDEKDPDEIRRSDVWEMIRKTKATTGAARFSARVVSLLANL